VWTKKTEVDDAFAQPWGLASVGGTLWANPPPFSLLGRMVVTVGREGARMVIVAQRWETEDWWPDLLALCTRRIQLGPGPNFLRGGTVPVREPDWEVWAFLPDSSGPTLMPVTPGGTGSTAERHVSLAPAGGLAGSL